MKKGFFKWVFSNVYFYIILFVLTLLSFFTEPESTIIESIIFLLIMVLIIALMLLIPFLIAKFINDDKKKKDFPIKSWKWIIYIFGWIGSLSLVFWIYQYIENNSGEKFFSMKFHKRTYYWGWIVLVIILVTILVSVFYLPKI